MLAEKILTIAIPTWNRAQLLEELLVQLTKQVVNYELESKIEVLISNNGSIDDTEIICLKYLALFPFLTYHNNGTNIGARNNVLKALELSSGRFSIFIGDDDRLRNDCLPGLVDFLDQNKTIGILLDSNRDKLNKLKDASHTLDQLLLKYYWFMGNAGVFIIKTSYVKEILQSHPYDFFNICWPQTQLMILGANMHPEDKIITKDLNLVGEILHQDVMMYSSYYLWNAGYFALTQAALEVKDEINASAYFSARKHLQNNIQQWIINIVLCGFYTDDRSTRIKTVKSIFQSFKILHLKEKIFLFVLSCALIVPVFITRIITNLFIFIFSGKKGLAKKNAFVTLELEKKKKKAKSIVVREFNFNQ